MSDAGRIAIRIDGVDTTVEAGTSVTVALMNAGIVGTRRSVDGERRGALCGMGICHECRLTIDDTPHRRGCVVSVRHGMVVVTNGDPSR